MEMRYLFKGKTICGDWVRGLLANNGDKWYISNNAGRPFAFEIRPDTICQCTGMKDKNGKLIWENDIVRTVYDGNEHIYQVVWDESELDFKAINGKENYESNFEYLPCCDEIEILGNCFDNPELLEV